MMGLSMSKNNSVEEFNPYDDQTLKMAMKRNTQSVKQVRETKKVNEFKKKCRHNVQQ